MSKPVKNLITKSYQNRFKDINGAVLIDVRGVEALDNNQMRSGLAEKGIKITVVKNSLAKKAFEGGQLAELESMIQGPSALVYAADDQTSVVSVARELITWAKEIKQMEFKGAIMEGITFGADQITALSKYPTKDEAQAQAVQLIFSPAQNLVGQIVGPGRNIASLVDAIKESKES